MEELFGQIVLIVMNSGFPVIVGNLAKNFIPQLDGKTDKVVNVLTAALFIYAWFEMDVYNTGLLYDKLPGIAASAREVIEWANAFLVGLVAVGLNKPIYEWLKGKLGRVFGRSFSG